MTTTHLPAPAADPTAVVDGEAEVFTVTDAAAAKIVQLAARDSVAPILRVRVLAGGCSGFTYELAFASEAEAADRAIDHAGATVLIDPASEPILAGSTLDFINSLMDGGLKVLNPQAVHECACGQSFSV